MGKLSSRVGHTLSRVVKGTVGLLLVPPTVGMARGLYGQLEAVPVGAHTAGVWFVWGLSGYTLLHVLLLKPSGLFALNHTLLARLGIWLFGGQVGTVGAETPAPAKPARGKRRNRSDEEDSDGSEAPASTLVVLSPYLLPIYVVLLCLAVWLVARQGGVSASWWPAAITAAVGVALSFHLAMTGEDLQQHAEQFPLETRLMALTISGLCSILVTSLCLPLALPGFRVSGVFAEMAASTRALYEAAFHALF